MDGNFDLFGNPDTLPSGRRGRPAHRPTRQNVNKVKMLLALGWGNEVIAQALGVSLPTLRKYYSSEISERDAQRARLTAWRFEKLFAEVEKGNVGAMRELDKQIEKNDRMHAARKITDAQRDDEESQVPAEKLGKKEKERRAAAKIASTPDTQDDGWGRDLNPGYRH